MPAPMRPETIRTPPPRLFETTAVYEEPDDELTGQKRSRTVALRLTVDLASVYAVRQVADYENGTPRAGECFINTEHNSWALRDDYARVLAAWQTWRTHADRIGALRN